MNVSNNPQLTPFSLAQTFFIDPARVAGADVIFITSVDLFFKALPIYGTNTLVLDPSVSVYFAPVENDVPQINAFYQTVFSQKRKSEITASSSTLVQTKFELNSPLPLKTGMKYAILLAFDGRETFVPWTAEAGGVNVSTGVRMTTDSGYVDGNLYEITNGRQLTPINGRDLAFNLNVANFVEQEANYQLVNRNYEFFDINEQTLSGTFLGGEIVFKQTNPETGTVSVVRGSDTVNGNGTSFSTLFRAGDDVIIESGPLKAARKVAAIQTGVSMTLNAPLPFTNNACVYKKTVTAKLKDLERVNDTMIVDDSTASNSSYRFEAGNVIVGSDSGATVTVTAVRDHQVLLYAPTHSFVVPAKTNVEQRTNFADTSYILSDTRTQLTPNKKQRHIQDYPAVIASRSNEVVNDIQLLPRSQKSMLETVRFTTENPYSSPYIKISDLSFYVTEPYINNDSTNEHTSNGNAYSKYVSTKFDLSNAQSAEDMRVFLSAYRPAGTTIEVYAKIQNPVDPESFEVKDWTKMQLLSTANSSMLSDPLNKFDTVDLEFAFPSYHPGTVVSGTFTVSIGSNVVEGTSGTVDSEVAEGDVVRISNPLYPENYFVTTVTSANSTTFTISGDSIDSDTVANNSLTGSSLIVENIVTYKHSAFNDNQNSNIVRYYNTSGSVFSTYKTFAIKIVLLSETAYRVPIVYDYRALALSA